MPSQSLNLPQGRLPRLLLLVVAVSAACFAAGHLVAGMWLQELIGVLAEAGIEVVLTRPAEARQQVLLAALSFAPAGVLAALVAWLVARIGHQDPRPGPYLRATALLFIGGNVGMAMKAVTVARLAVPQAVERSIMGDALMLDIAGLALAPWSLAGVGCAAILYLAVGGVFAMVGPRG